MENPESPHDWIAHQELEVPELEDLNLRLVEESSALEDFYVLQP